MSPSPNPDPDPPIHITLDHIGIATEGVEEAIARLAAIFPGFSEAASTPERVDAEGVRLSFVDAGGARLEFLEGLTEESAIRRHVARRGPGIHHLSFRVEGVDIETWFRELRQRGVELVGDGPTEGAGGHRVFFVHPRATGGLLLEFSQERTQD